MLALAVSRGLTPGDLAHLALPQSSIGAALLDLAARHLAQQERPGWKRRLPGLARFLP